MSYSAVYYEHMKDLQGHYAYWVDAVQCARCRYRGPTLNAACNAGHAYCQLQLRATVWLRCDNVRRYIKMNPEARAYNHASLHWQPTCFDSRIQ